MAWTAEQNLAWLKAHGFKGTLTNGQGAAFLKANPDIAKAFYAAQNTAPAAATGSTGTTTAAAAPVTAAPTAPTGPTMADYQSYMTAVNAKGANPGTAATWLKDHNFTAQQLSDLINKSNTDLKTGYENRTPEQLAQYQQEMQALTDKYGHGYVNPTTDMTPEQLADNARAGELRYLLDGEQKDTWVGEYGPYIAGLPAAAILSTVIGPQLVAGLAGTAGAGGAGAGAAGATGGGFSLGGLLDGAGSAISSAVGGVGDLLGGAASGIGDALSGVGSGLGSAISGAAGGIGDLLSGATSGIGSALSGIGSGVSGLVSGVGSALTGGGGTGGAGGLLTSLLGGGSGGSGSSLLDLLLSGASSYNNYNTTEDIKDQLLKSQGEASALLQPYIDRGNNYSAKIDKTIQDTPDYGGMISKDVASGDLGGKFTTSDFQADPGYQFRKDEGNKALLRSLSAMGMSQSGPAVKEAVRFNQGLADQTYQDAFNRDQTYQKNRYDILSGQQTTRNNLLTGQQDIGVDATGNLASLLLGNGEIKALSSSQKSNILSQLLSSLK